MSINSIGSNIPIEVSKGGIGVGTLTQYGVLYGNVTGPVQATAVGTAGQVLTSNGAGVAPTFQPVGGTPGASAWTFIQSQTAAASASLIFNTGLSANFQTIVFVASGITSSVVNDLFVLDTSTDGGSTFPASTCTGGAIYSSASTGVLASSSSSTTIAISPPNILNTPANAYSSIIYFFGSSTPSNNQGCSGTFILSNNTSTPYFGWISGANATSGFTITINGYRFRMVNGNIATGTVTLYGIRNS